MRRIGRQTVFGAPRTSPECALCSGRIRDETRDLGESKMVLIVRGSPVEGCARRVSVRAIFLASMTLTVILWLQGAVQAQETTGNSEYLLSRGTAAYEQEDYETAEQYLSLLSSDPSIPTNVAGLAAFPRIRSELNRERWSAVAVSLSELQDVDFEEPWDTERENLEAQIAETLVESFGAEVHGVRLDTVENLRCLVRPSPQCVRSIAEAVELPPSEPRALGFAHSSAANYWSLAGDSGRAIQHLEKAVAAAREEPQEGELGLSRSNSLASVAYKMALIGALQEARIVSQDADRERRDIKPKPGPTKGINLGKIAPSPYEVATLQLASVEYLLGNGSRGDDLINEVLWPSWREQPYAARVAWARKAGRNRDLASSLRKFRASLENDRGMLSRRSENSKNRSLFKFVLRLIEVGEDAVAKNQLAESDLGWGRLSIEAEKLFSPDAKEVSERGDRAFWRARYFLDEVGDMISVFTRFEYHQDLEKIAVFLRKKSLDHSLPKDLRIRCLAMLSVVLETLGNPEDAGEAAGDILKMLDNSAESFSRSKFFSYVGVRHGRTHQLFWEALSKGDAVEAQTELFRLAQLIDDPWTLIMLPDSP